MGMDVQVGVAPLGVESPETVDCGVDRIALAATAGIATVVAATATMPDDAWIYLRYARHLADGAGWRYNLVGETADAATSLVHTLMLAGLGGLGVPLQTAARGVSAVGLWAMMTLALLVFRRSGRPLSGWVFAAAVATAPTVWAVGMETTTCLALLMAAVVLYLQRQDVWLGIVLGTLPFVRPEAGVAALVVVVALGHRDRRLPWRVVAVGAAVGAAWLAVQVVMVGELLPMTGSAKLAQGRSGLWPGFVEGLAEDVMRHAVWGPAVLLAGVAGVATARDDARTMLLLLGAVALSIAAALEAAGVAFYGWYSAPVLMALLLGLAWFAGASPVHAVLVGGFVLAAAIPPTWSYEQPLDDYRIAGEWIAAHADRADTVSATEIGVIGFTSHRCVIEYLGLLDPVASEHVVRADFDWWADHYQPDYIVTSRLVYFEAPALEAVRGSYRRVFASGPVHVLERTRGMTPRSGLCVEP